MVNGRVVGRLDEVTREQPQPGSTDPVEPEPTQWALGAAVPRPGEDLVAVGGDLRPGTVLAGYRNGLFPMGLEVGGSGPLGWWSPDPRGVLTPGDLHISRSLRRSLKRFTVRVDTAFGRVMAACADPNRPGAWITPEITEAYTHLHQLGWAHSVEIWEDGDLTGGLYGVSLGSLFAAESMFHRATDASKAAVVALVALLDDSAGEEGWLVDVQWPTAHLASLGIRTWPRDRYLSAVPRLTGARHHPHRWRAGSAIVGSDRPGDSAPTEVRLTELLTQGRPCGMSRGGTR